MARYKGGVGNKVTPEGEYALGTEAEINNRDKTGYQNPASSFRQPGNNDTGKRLARPSTDSKSGNLKWSSGV